ncbi:MAG: DUF4019 domain-containing protein [Janthinobacterium lividum]
MRLAAVLLSLAASSFAFAAAAQEPGQDRAAAPSADAAAAADAAKAWLALADAGRHGEGWAASAAALRGAVPLAQWEAAMAAVRTPLGAVVSRTLSSSHPTRTLPGAPEGEYVVLQYRTDFANRAGAVETVTPMRDADGTWRVSGYYVK